MTPEQVGPYRIVRQLGRGGMAVVYLARQPALARSVALKELAPFVAGDPALAQRFILEARVAGSLSHPNVVTVFDFLEQDGVPYIAMEYLERGSLRPFVGRMSLPQVAGVLEGLLAALAHAEAMKIVHRDVKPENLLVTGDGGVKIADFGIAKAIQKVTTEEMLTPAGVTVGTPAYMAPEQAMGQEIGGWTDLYQTGVVAFELLTGGVPFRAAGPAIAVLMQHIADPVPPLPAGTDPGLEDWLRRMMAKEPADRPRDARVAWDQLEEIVLELHGPLWRRGARLGEHEPTSEHPTPLTPARFSSWQHYTPQDSSTPPPPPPPAFTSGYVDYVVTQQSPREGVSRPAEELREDDSPPWGRTPPPAVEPSPPPEPEPPPPVTSGFFDYVPDDPARERPLENAAPPRHDVAPGRATPPPPPPPPPPTTPVPVTPPGDAPPVRPPPGDPAPAESAPTVAPTRPVPSAPPERRRLRAPVLGVLGLVVAAIIAIVVILSGGDDTPTATPTPAATAAQPPTGPFAVGDAPDGIAIGAGAIWAVGSGDGTLTRIDPATGKTTSVDIGENPDSVVVALDSVWVSVTGENKVVRLSADARPQVQDTYDVGAKPEGMAASGRAVWVANSGDGTVSQIVLANATVNSVRVGGRPVDLAIGAGAVWVADAAGGDVARVDGGKGQLVARVKVGPNPRAVAIVGRDVWAATAGDGKAWQIAADENRTSGSVEVGGQPRDVATNGERLFVTDREGDRVVTIDAQSRAVTKRDTVEDGPLSVAADANDLWITRIDGDDVVRIPDGD